MSEKSESKFVVGAASDGTQSAFLLAREAELAAGRERFNERHSSDEDSAKFLEEAEKQRQEDEERRASLLEAGGLGNQAERDRAGAEVGDQAQTMLEGIKHLADREETIFTRQQDQEAEALIGRADPETAHEIATEMTIAQAVNQPTPLANDAGQETEDRPLNLTTFEDRVLALTAIPEEKHVPKTRSRAKQIAEMKVPPAEKIVHEDNLDDAVEVVAATPDEALS